MWLIDNESRLKPYDNTDLSAAYIKYRQQKSKEFKESLLNREEIKKIAAVVVEEIENALNGI